MVSECGRQDVDPNITLELGLDDVELVDDVDLREARLTAWRDARQMLAGTAVFAVIVAAAVSTAVSMVAGLSVESRVRAELAAEAGRSCPSATPGSFRPESPPTLTVPTVEIRTR